MAVWVVLSDLFRGYISDLHLGNQKVTWKKLAKNHPKKKDLNQTCNFGVQSVTVIFPEFHMCRLAPKKMLHYQELDVILFNISLSTNGLLVSFGS